MLDLAKDADRGAKEVEAKAHAMEEKIVSTASRAIEDFKSSEDFKTEVGDAVYNVYMKGFIECKAKVSKAFSGLNLRGFIANAGDEGEEESEAETEAKTSKKVLVTKLEETRTVAITEIMVAEGAEEPMEIMAKIVTEKDKLSVMMEMMEVIKRVGIEEEIVGFVSMLEAIAQVVA